MKRDPNDQAYDASKQNLICDNCGDYLLMDRHEGYLPCMNCQEVPDKQRAADHIKATGRGPNQQEATK